MLNSAAQIMQDSIDIGYGYIQGHKEERRYMVSGDRGVFPAHKAVGCLIEPRPGDMVLYCSGNAGKNFILSVLQQRNPQESIIRMNGDVAFQLPDNRLTIHAGKGVSIRSGNELSLESQEFTLAARKGKVFCRELSCAGDFFSGRFVKARIVAGYLESVFDKMIQRVNRCFRIVSGLEHLKAGRLKIWAKETVQVKSRSASFHASEKMKMDSEKIYLG